MPNRSALCFAAVVSVCVACAAAAAADVDAVALEAHADFAGAAAALEAKGDAASVDHAVDLRLGLGDDAAVEADLKRLQRLDALRWVQAVVRVAKNEAGRRRCPAAIARLGAASRALSRAHVDVGVVIDATLALARCHEGADFAAARVARRRALAFAAGGANASTRKDVVAAVADAEVDAAAESIRTKAKAFPPGRERRSSWAATSSSAWRRGCASAPPTSTSAAPRCAPGSTTSGRRCRPAPASTPTRSAPSPSHASSPRRARPRPRRSRWATAV